MKKRSSSPAMSVAYGILLIIFLNLIAQIAAASERTVGLISRDVRASEGYTLSKPFKGFGPESDGLTFYLLNNAGNPVHEWTTPLPTRTGGFMFLRDNGELVFSANDGFFALNPDGTLAWNIDLGGMPVAVQRHHEIVEMPNGNMLIPAYILLSPTEATTAGFDVAGTAGCFGGPLTTLYVDNIWELAPTTPECGFACGWEVVWRWNLLDHVVQDDNTSNDNWVSNIADYPEKADIGYVDAAGGLCSQRSQGMWNFGRFNALDYHPDRDEIIISASLFNEIWVIDHNLTTEQASGPDGDLLYRWGNPYAYGAGEPFVDANDRGDQELSFQHRVHWIADGLNGAGHVLIFNNGTDWGSSKVMEVTLPTDNGGYQQPENTGEAFPPAALVWDYADSDTPGAFFAGFVSSAQRLPNGNTLINNGPAGYFFEVTPEKEKVWEYIYPDAGYPTSDAEQGVVDSLRAYRAWRYPPDFPGLAYLDLTPDDPLEQYPNTYVVDIKPGSCENPVNRGKKGMLTVAILGSADLDVSTIDPGSIFLEGFPAARWSIEDAGAPGECDNLDGYPDLVLKWDGEVVNIALGTLSKGDEFTVRLTGDSSDGWFLGKDMIAILK